MKRLNQNGTDFIKGIDFALKKIATSEETIKTSSAATTLAVVYEAARNAIEFRSDHLIRQAAIVRILRRRFFLGQVSAKLAPILIKELIWARYLKDDFVAVSKINEIEKIIDTTEKELPLIKTFFISGGTELSALFDVARTIARKAERRVVEVSEEGKVKIRTTRDEVWKHIQKKEKEGTLTEDEKFRFKEDMQRTVDSLLA